MVDFRVSACHMEVKEGKKNPLQITGFLAAKVSTAHSVSTRKPQTFSWSSASVHDTKSSDSKMINPKNQHFWEILNVKYSKCYWKTFFPYCLDEHTYWKVKYPVFFQTSHGLTFLPDSSTFLFVLFAFVLFPWCSMNANLLEKLNYIPIFSCDMNAYIFSPAWGPAPLLAYCVSGKTMNTYFLSREVHD